MTSPATPVDLETLSISQLVRVYNEAQDDDTPFLKTFKDKPTALSRTRAALDKAGFTFFGFDNEGSVGTPDLRVTEPTREDDERELDAMTSDPGMASQEPTSAQQAAPAPTLPAAAQTPPAATQAAAAPAPAVVVGRRGPAPAYADDDTLWTTGKPHSYKPGTSIHRRWSCVRDGMTVREYMTAASLWDQRPDEWRGDVRGFAAVGLLTTRRPASAHHVSVSPGSLLGRTTRANPFDLETPIRAALEHLYDEDTAETWWQACVAAGVPATADELRSFLEEYVRRSIVTVHEARS